jgi:hypothetical protein
MIGWKNLAAVRPLNFGKSGRKAAENRPKTGQKPGKKIF